MQAAQLFTTLVFEGNDVLLLAHLAPGPIVLQRVILKVIAPPLKLINPLKPFLVLTLEV